MYKVKSSVKLWILIYLSEELRAQKLNKAEKIKKK